MRGISPDDLYRFRWVDHVRLDPSGTRIAFSVTHADAGAREYRSRISVAGLTGAASDRPREIGDGRRDRSPEWSPDGSALAYTSRRAGRDQVFVLRLGGGEPVALTALKDGATAPRWSPEGGRIAFLGTVLADPDAVVDDPRPSESEDQVRRPPVVRVARRLDYRHDGRGYNDGRHPHLFVVDAGAAEAAGAVGAVAEPVQLTDGAWDVEDFDWSPSADRWAVAGNAEPDADLTTVTHLYVVDGEGGRRRLTDGLVVSTPAWSPRGDLVAFLSPQQADGGRHERVWVVAADGGEPRCLTAAFDRSAGGTVFSDMRAGHSTRLCWSEDGSRIYFQAAGPGTAEVFSVDLAGAVRPEVEIRQRAVFDFDVRAGTVAFLATDPWTPGDLHVRRGGQESRLSDFNDWLRERELAVPEKHVFRAPDGLEIDGWLLRALGDGKAGKAPLVLEVHGGPHGQYGWAFFLEFQVLASMGMHVLLCNPRGSDGRGEEFKRAVVRDWAGKDFEDLMAALDQAIERTGAVDEARLGIGGGSYGGYMTNWAIGQTDRFAAAVAMRSISNLVSDYVQQDIVPWARNEVGPEPWPDPEELWRRSPIRYVRNVRTPLLLVHGEMDIRCSVAQAEEMFGALRLLGREVELARFPGESHDLSRSGRPDRRVERLVRVAGWFGRHLLGVGAEASGEAESPA